MKSPKSVKGINRPVVADFSAPARNPKIHSETLTRALAERLKDRTQADLARQSGVSTRTLARLVGDGWTQSEVTASAAGRLRVGLAESFTRLSLFLKLDPTKVLQEIGIWDAPGVQAKSRSTSAEMVSTAGQDLGQDRDRALTNIAVRGRVADQKGVVNVALLAWEPFHPPGAGEESFARKYCRALLGALSPDWTIAFSEFRSLDDCLRALTENSAGPGSSTADGSVVRQQDLVFGLYDLVTREASGIDFIPVPGLAVQGGAICIGRRLTWFDILSPRSEEERPFALVVRSEAGWSTLAGACGYPKSYLRQFDSMETSDIVAEFLALAATKWRDGGVPVCFVADAFTIERVWKALQGESSVADVLHLVEDDSDWAPRYSLGLGVRADSPRFAHLLQRATSHDLFGFALPQTARTYWSLFRSRQDDERVQVRTGSLRQLGDKQLDLFKSALRRTAPSGDEELFVHRSVWRHLFSS